MSWDAWTLGFPGMEDLHWQVQALIRLAVASFLGGLVGWERGHHGRSAGIRTQLLVALGSTLVMVVSLHFARMFDFPIAEHSTLRIDPARMAYGVMAGVGFLGAGAILQKGMNIQGVTTAASIWCTAAIGLACGFGLFLLAGFTTLIVLFSLVVLNHIGRRVTYRIPKMVSVTIPVDREDVRREVERAFAAQKLDAATLDCKRDSHAEEETITYRVLVPSTRDLRSVRGILAGVEDVRGWRIR